VERAVLSRAALDRIAFAAGRHTLPVRGLPLQFCELSEMPREIRLAASDAHAELAPGQKENGSK
jgi:hypothetical protein